MFRVETYFPDETGCIFSNAIEKVPDVPQSSISRVPPHQSRADAAGADAALNTEAFP
jgi:hypothetical protein